MRVSFNRDLRLLAQLQNKFVRTTMEGGNIDVRFWFSLHMGSELGIGCGIACSVSPSWLRRGAQAPGEGDGLLRL